MTNGISGGTGGGRGEFQRKGDSRRTALCDRPAGSPSSAGIPMSDWIAEQKARSQWRPPLSNGSDGQSVRMACLLMNAEWRPRTLKRIAATAGISLSTLQRARAGKCCSARTADALNAIAKKDHEDPYGNHNET